MAYEGGTMNADGALRDVLRQLPGGGEKWKHAGFYGKRKGNARKIIHGVIVEKRGGKECGEARTTL